MVDRLGSPLGTNLSMMAFLGRISGLTEPSVHGSSKGFGIHSGLYIGVIPGEVFPHQESLPFRDLLTGGGCDPFRPFPLMRSSFKDDPTSF